MSHTRLWASAGIIAVIITASFMLSVPRTRDVTRAPVSEGVETATTAPLVSLRDSFKKGTHTITGSVEAPNACADVTVNATLGSEGSSDERIDLAITLSKTQGICLELPTRMEFSTTITAPAGLPIAATVNGIPATTTP